jgi:N-acetylglutamate synthase-like GNAT family acetyltransferase
MRQKKWYKGYIIRLFGDVDLGSLHHMICDTIDASYSGVYPVRAVQFFKEFHSEERIKERSHAGEVLIIERGGFIIATGALVGNEILGVFVKPDNQGQGYGKTIMSEFESRAKAKGLSEVVLSVSLSSRKFYENLGFEVLAECSLVVGEGQHLDYWPGRKTLTEWTYR